MNRKQRVLWADGGTLRDVTNDLNDFRRGTLTFDAQANEYLYVASELPFNHKYFDVGVVNAQASVITVETWNGSEWIAAVDVVDETAVSGACLAQSGLVSFAVDIDRSAWSCHRDSNTIAALVGTRVFGMYWARFKFSATLTALTTLKYVGQRFSDDDDLDDYYPDLRQTALKTAFEAGKTDWKAQSFAAAEAIVADLRAQAIVVRRDQIFDVSLFALASVHKTAAIIFTGLGANWSERADRAEKAYKAALSLKAFEVDSDGSGAVSTVEKTMTTGFGTR